MQNIEVIIKNLERERGVIGRKRRIDKKLSAVYIAYPELIVSFLAERINITPHNNTTVKDAIKNEKLAVLLKYTYVPKFTIYPLYGKNSFTMLYKGCVCHGTCCMDSIAFENGQNLPSILFDNLSANFRPQPYFRRRKHLLSNGISLVGDVRAGCHNRHPARAKIESRFNGVIPDKTKNKIRQARQYFKKRELYIIAETEVGDWNVNLRGEVTRITKDPLIVGVKYDACFLIDWFNTTTLEEYIAMEFTHPKDKP